MNFTIDYKKIVFANGYSLEFEYPLKKTLIVNDVIIIMVESPFNVTYNQNIFAITTSGDFLWRIKEVELYYTGVKDCQYVGIEKNDENELVLFNWCDTAVIVNPNTGEVIRKYHTK